MKLKFCAFAAISPLTITAAHGNQLTNGSFESGLTGWSASAPISVRSDQQPSDGSSSLVFDYGVGVFGSELSQSFAIAPGTTYTLELDYWALGTPTQRRLLINVSLYYAPASGYVTILNAEVFPTASVSASYQTFNGSFTVPSFFPANPPAILLFKDLTTGSSNAFSSDLNIDRVSINAVPEPATYAQLTLGFFALIATHAISRFRSTARGRNSRANRRSKKFFQAVCLKRF